MDVRAPENERAHVTALRALFECLETYKIKFWGTHYREEQTEAEVLAQTAEADVVASRYVGEARHAVVLDIDHPTWLVRSSTPGHYHLYIDVPGGIPHEDYMNLLYHLARCGVIEPGYFEVSKKRGRSDVRLPWIKKQGTEGTA